MEDRKQQHADDGAEHAVDAADGARHMVGSPLQHEESRDHAPVRAVEAEGEAYQHGNGRGQDNLLGGDHGVRISDRGAIQAVAAGGAGVRDGGAIRIDVGDMIGELIRIGAQIQGAVMRHDGVLGREGALH